MPARHEDLNQSSRLDLDYNEEGDWGQDSYEYSPTRLNQIEESQSFASSDDESSSAFASSVESTVVLEDATSDDGDALRSEGQDWPGGGGVDREGEPKNQGEPKQLSQQHESNGFHAAANDRPARGVQREGTLSTMNTSTSSSPRSGETESGRKIVKIKLSWDPDQSSAEPTVVTVAMDMMSSSQETGDNVMDNLGMGVGQKIQLCQQPLPKEGRYNYSDGEEKAVDISWQPPPRAHEEAWQPPLIISEEDRRIAPHDQRGSYDALGSYRSNQTQSTWDEKQVEDRRSLVPSTTSSAPITEASDTTAITDVNAPEDVEALPTPVKGLEPFTIPSILSSTVIKRTPTEKVGLAFRKATGTVVIEKIVPGSAFDGTLLRPGYECLSINGHRLRSARRAAEIVRESGSSLTLVASNAPRPPGTMYTMISLEGRCPSMGAGSNMVAGMYFNMKHGLVQLVRVDENSPIGSTSMKVGDFMLAINGSVLGSTSKAVEVLSGSNVSDMVPILYFNMRQLRVSLVDKVIGDLWKKEWSETYDECVVLQPAGSNGSSSPLTLRFKEEGMCELLDPLRAFRGGGGDEASSVVPPDHPLNSVVETLNHGIICVLSAIREGVELATTSGTPSKNSASGQSISNGSKKSSEGGKGSLIGELAKLSEMYKEGLLSKDDFEAIKSKLLKS